MQYFNCLTNLTSVEDVKSEYRRLAMLHHPDRGGSTEAMQAINAEYHALLSKLNGAEADGRTYRYSFETEQGVIDKLNEVLSKQFIACTVAVIGTWIWVRGKTKPVKEELTAGTLALWP